MAETLNAVSVCRYESCANCTPKSIENMNVLGCTRVNGIVIGFHWFKAINHNAVTMPKRKFPSQTQLWNKSHSPRSTTKCKIFAMQTNVQFKKRLLLLAQNANERTNEQERWEEKGLREKCSIWRWLIAPMMMIMRYTPREMRRVYVFHYLLVRACKSISILT